MRLKAVFLDAGGTLLRERTPRAAIYTEAARARGLDIDAESMAKRMREARDALPRFVDGAFRYTEAWFDAFIERIFEQGLGLSAARREDVARELKARFADPGEFRLYDGAVPLVRDLRAAGLWVGVLSNWSERLLDLLAGFDLLEELDGAVVSATVRCEKPEREIFVLALELAGARPEEALHVGDRLDNDVRGATAAGIRAVLVDHEGAHEGFAGERVGGLDELRARILAEVA